MELCLWKQLYDGKCKDRHVFKLLVELLKLVL